MCVRVYVCGLLQAEEVDGCRQRRITIVPLLFARKTDSSFDLFWSGLVQKCTDICFVVQELQDSRFSRDQLQPSFSFCYVNQFVMASKSTWLVQSKFYTRAVVSVDFAARQSAITSADFAVRSSAVAWTYFGAGPEGKRQQKQEPKAQSRKVEPSTKILFLQL
ncbi:hypothetical protein VPH35_058345 [Triticum aestivum]|uniref:uncharacterized protein n=1 Tax=Triticum aestivum TaxID=4565 RepID=UPI001D033B5A|nr:uncharacterized protein LOC123077352 [Triticum aestivum]